MLQKGAFTCVSPKGLIRARHFAQGGFRVAIERAQEGCNATPKINRLGQLSFVLSPPVPWRISLRDLKRVKSVLRPLFRVFLLCQAEEIPARTFHIQSKMGCFKALMAYNPPHIFKFTYLYIDLFLLELLLNRFLVWWMLSSIVQTITF